MQASTMKSMVLLKKEVWTSETISTSDLKSGNIEKNILKNRLRDTFPSRKIRHHPRVRYRKILPRMRTLRKEKKLLRKKNEKKWKR